MTEMMALAFDRVRRQLSDTFSSTTIRTQTYGEQSHD